MVIGAAARGRAWYQEWVKERLYPVKATLSIVRRGRRENFLVDGEVTTIGSDFLASDIYFADDQIAARCATLEEHAEGLVLRKEFADTSIRLNGKPMQERRAILRPKDKISLSEAYSLTVIELTSMREAHHVDDTFDEFASMKQTIEEGVSWLNPHVERVGSWLVAKLVLPEGAGFKGTLRARVGSSGAVFMFKGDIHLSTRIAKITAQKRGIAGFLQTINELKVGEREVDSAFYIEGEDLAQEMMSALTEPLRRFIDHSVEIEIQRESVELIVNARTALTLEVLENIAAFWRTLCIFRMSEEDRER